MRVLDLFSGIGGFSLGLERAGMKTVAFCEIDPYCRAVLKKHWPTVPCFPDVSELCRRTYMNEPADDDWVECSVHAGQDFGDCPCIGTDQFLDEIGPVDVTCGGFPCQDVSHIGKREGIGGAKSGLWAEYRRIIGELEPGIAVVENVAALTGRGLDRVLGDLSSLGYDAEWHCIPASYVGAPHRRDRIWIVAHSRRKGLEGHAWDGEKFRRALADRSVGAQGVLRGEHPSAWWHAEPGVGRVADGVPRLVDRLTCLGNAVVPQVAQIIGEAIVAL